MHVTPEERFELRLEEIPAAIRRAGFVPGDMTLRARGTFVPEGDQVAFLIRGWPRTLPVRARPPVPEGETELHARVDYSGDRIALEPIP